MPFNRIILLAGKWDSTPLVYNYLQQHFHVDHMIIEDSVSRKDFLKRRAKKLGWFTVGGQVLFQLLTGKPQLKKAKARIAEIIQQYNLSTAPVPADRQTAVSSVNDQACIDKLQQLKPDLIIVHGTRIISKKVLAATNALFINIHAGVTPRYRGSHGAYWALYNNDAVNAGVTVHAVDSGIDTGGILAQGAIPITPKDNFSTYPYLQLGEGLRLLDTVINEMDKGTMPAVKNDLDSGLWHHPTIWGYWWKRITKGVK